MFLQRSSGDGGMSNDATHWAVKQRGLKPATKIVLWHLADRHNPDSGCFPSQERLAHDCEMSRSTVNEHLNILEAMGLIRRERRVNAQTRRQESTRYLLAFEEGYSADSPCPKKVPSRVRKKPKQDGGVSASRRYAHGGDDMPLKLKKRGKYWHISGTVSGREIRRSTGTTDKAIAKRIRAEAEAAPRRAACLCDFFVGGAGLSGSRRV